MIKRIVKLTFREDATEAFQAIFEEQKRNIRNFEGCRHLELWQDRNQKNVFFTYSYWDSEIALDAYRNSDLFQGVWKRTKALFEDKPQAWSVDLVSELE